MGGGKWVAGDAKEDNFTRVKEERRGKVRNRGTVRQVNANEMLKGVQPEKVSKGEECEQNVK